MDSTTRLSLVARSEREGILNHQFHINKKPEGIKDCVDTYMKLGDEFRSKVTPVYFENSYLTK